MTPRPFSFTGDSSGSPDPITLPMDNVEGKKRCRIKPPSGHEWTYFDQAGNNYPLGMDEAFDVVRESGQAAFQPGEIIGFVSLDTGSGTFSGLLT